MSSSQLSEENSNNELFDNFLKLSKNSKNLIKSSKMLSKKNSFYPFNSLNHML
jgi:hypothetical protein